LALSETRVLGSALKIFWKIYFVSLVVKIIRRFGFRPIYTNLIVPILVAQAVDLFSSTPGLFHLIDFGVGLC